MSLYLKTTIHKGADFVLPTQEFSFDDADDAAAGFTGYSGTLTIEDSAGTVIATGEVSFPSITTARSIVYGADLGLIENGTAYRFKEIVTSGTYTNVLRYGDLIGNAMVTV